MHRSNRDKIFDKIFIAALALLFVTTFIVGWLLLHQTVLFLPLAMMAGLLMLAQTIYYLEIKRELGQPHENYRQVEALFSMFSTLKLRHPLPPMRVWPISPDFANIVISLIAEHRPGLVLEITPTFLPEHFSRNVRLLEFEHCSIDRRDVIRWTTDERTGSTRVEYDDYTW